MYKFSSKRDLVITTQSMRIDSLEVIFIDNLEDFGEQYEIHRNKYNNVIFVVEENIRYDYDIGRIPKNIQFATYDSRCSKSTDSILSIFNEGLKYGLIFFINFSDSMKEDIRVAIPMFNYSNSTKLEIIY